MELEELTLEVIVVAEVLNFVVVGVAFPKRHPYPRMLRDARKRLPTRYVVVTCLSASLRLLLVTLSAAVRSEQALRRSLSMAHRQSGRGGAGR